MINALIHTTIKILIGWVIFDMVPRWLSLKGLVSTIVKIIGVLIMISAITAWL